LQGLKIKNEKGGLQASSPPSRGSRGPSPWELGSIPMGAGVPPEQHIQGAGRAEGTGTRVPEGRMGSGGPIVWGGGRGGVKVLADREWGGLGLGEAAGGPCLWGWLWGVNPTLGCRAVCVPSWCLGGDLAAPASATCVGFIYRPRGGTPTPPSLLPPPRSPQHFQAGGTWAGAAPEPPSPWRCPWQLVAVELSSRRSQESRCSPRCPRPCSPPWVPSASGLVGAPHPARVLTQCCPTPPPCKPTGGRCRCSGTSACLSFPGESPACLKNESLGGGGSRAGEQDGTRSSSPLPPRCPNAQCRNEAEPVLCTHGDAASTQKGALVPRLLPREVAASSPSGCLTPAGAGLRATMAACPAPGSLHGKTIPEG